MDQAALDDAVQFALDNEIDWPVDISQMNVGQDAPQWAAKLGPFKDRGGPAGVVVKDGYIVAEWGADCPLGHPQYRGVSSRRPYAWRHSGGPEGHGENPDGP